jgi:3',5'-cyclic AMP phosphodiesterase CpdA
VRLFSIVLALALSAGVVPSPASFGAVSQRLTLSTVFAGAQAVQAPARPSEVLPPREKDSVKFAIIGDSGTGSRSQYEVGAQMAKAREQFPFEFVIMLGDNIYGSERPQDFVRKFEKPYEALLGAKVPFYASLGNHDDPTQRFYKPFNMDGERYYSFRKGSARFFALDSNYMDQPQLKWLEDQLSRATDRWKVAFFHHPLYSSGERHGSETDLRALLEPLFIKYGVDLVFAGHEHFYERIHPQNGIFYFTVGGSAKLRRGNIRKGPLTAAGLDTDYSFMMAELGETDMQFQALTRSGKRVDAGTHALSPEPRKTETASDPSR